MLVSGLPRDAQAQFAAGRACAHAALARFGMDCTPLLRSPSGAPIWPRGMTGSLAHCRAAAVAIVAHHADWTALGIDVEIDRPLSRDAARHVLVATEQADLERLPGGLTRWGLAAFVAKECVHKCLSPQCDLALDFAEVTIGIMPGRPGDADGFVVTPHSTAARAAMAGIRWSGALRRADGLLFGLWAGR